MTSDFFARQWTGYLNETRRSLGLLVGIIQGILGDGELTEGEIRFLDAWLRDNDAISTSWPGDILHQKIRAVLEDGVITSAERLHLIETLQDLVGAPKADLAARSHVTELAYDDVPQIRFPGSTFCLTGDFLYGSRDSCAAAITKRGGLFVGRITMQLGYLVLGSLGSPEWKHGSFGTKIEKAMEYKQRGLPIKVIREQTWSAALGKGA